MFTLTDLDAFRSAGEYATYIGDLDARLRELDAKHPGQPLGEDERAEFSAIQDIRREAVSRQSELEARASYLATLAADQKRTVPASPAAIGAPQVVKAKRVPEDIYALEQYRALSGSHDQMLQAYRDGAMYAVERASYPNPNSVPDRERAHIQFLLDNADAPSEKNSNRELARLILATGHPGYLRAFTKYIQGRPMTAEDQMRAAAPLTVQTDATGGYAVPFYFDPTILHTGAWTAINPYRQACTVKTIVGTDTYNAPTAAAFTVGRAAEAAAAVEGPGAVGQISAIVGKVHGFGGLSLELLQDRPDIVSEIASLISEAKDTEEESSFSTGIGDALGQGFNPIGMFAAHGTAGAFDHIHTAGSNTIAVADLNSLEAGLPIRHRFNAAAFMSRGVIRIVQGLETVAGQYLQASPYYGSAGTAENNRAGNTGLKLFGTYPIWETPSAPADASVDNAITMVLANPSRFYIVERVGMTVEVIPHIFDGANPSMPLGRRGIYAWWRNTAKPADTSGGLALAALP